MTFDDSPSLRSLQSGILPIRRNWLPWCVLAVALACVLLSWEMTRRSQAAAAARQFAIVADNLAETLQRRMVDHERILLGGAGLFDASGEVNRQDWKRYVDRLMLQNHYPGIQGVGYSAMVDPARRAGFEAGVRADGFPGFAIRPAGAREPLSAIVYLEPFDRRNLAAFGYDMLSEPVRREAMLAAARSGQARLSGPVTLVQEIDAKVQPGILMYVPVYRQGLPLATEAQRLVALRGFVYSPYRLHDLIEGMLPVAELPVDFRLHQGAGTGGRLLYGGAAPEVGALSARRTLHFYGQAWTLEIWPKAVFVAPFERGTTLLPALGVALSLLLFLLLASLMRRREQAQLLADAMTAELSERRQALRLSEERLALALKGSNDGWWDLDLRGHRFFLSDRGWQMLGRENPGWLAHRFGWRGLFPAQERRALHTALRAALRAGSEHFSIDSRLLDRREQEVPVLLRGYIQRDGLGRGVRLTGTIMDLTERKRIERMKDEFVSTVSHELRTPLTSIAGALGLLRGGALGPVPEAMLQMVAIAHQNSLRLTHLINDLLDMDKLVAGKMVFELGEHALDEIIADSVQANQAYADQMQVRLDCGPCAPVRVRVDALRLQQVLANLLSNAIKFSAPGAAVALRCRMNWPRIRVSVADRGPGIPAAFQKHIFQKFTQADGGSARHKGGTGLGLAISKELVERMDGRIGFDSEEGQGASFWFELPVRGMAAPRPAPQAGGGMPRVLHVEDDADVCRLVSELGRQYARFVAAATIAEARALLMQQRFDLVLLDVNLPDGSCLELLDELTAQHPDLPVLVLSGGEAPAAVAARADAALLKTGLRTPEFLAQLARLLPAAAVSARHETQERTADDA